MPRTWPRVSTGACVAGAGHRRRRRLRLTDDLVTVRGYANAQNSFGAKLRNDWLCTATVSPKGDVSNVQAVVTTP